MSDRFDATTRKVHIRDLVVAYDPKRVPTLGRTVDVPICRKRGGGHKKHALFRNPAP
jgi:hypothetical protein